MYKTPRHKQNERLIIQCWADEARLQNSREGLRRGLYHALGALFMVVFLILMVKGCSKLAVADTTIDSDSIANAIYKIEGGLKTKYPYGIKAVHARTVTEARIICKRTIEHKWRDYAKLPLQTRQKLCFLDYLGNKYCPYSADKQGNINWKRNIHKIMGV